MLRDPKYRKLLNNMPCCACDSLPPCEAAHIRRGSNAGMGQKPHDNRCVSLCKSCHSRQHSRGEISFWYPFGGYEAAAVFANKLYDLRDSEQAMVEEIIEFREKKHVSHSE